MFIQSVSGEKYFTGWIMEITVLQLRWYIIIWQKTDGLVGKNVGLSYSWSSYCTEGRRLESRRK